MVMVNKAGGVAGRGVQGSGPPELPSGVHAKRKNPVRIFFPTGGVGSCTLMTNSPGPPPEPYNPPTPLNKASCNKNIQ